MATDSLPSPNAGAHSGLPMLCISPSRPSCTWIRLVATASSVRFSAFVMTGRTSRERWLSMATPTFPCCPHTASVPFGHCSITTTVWRSTHEPSRSGYPRDGRRRRTSHPLYRVWDPTARERTGAVCRARGWVR